MSLLLVLYLLLEQLEEVMAELKLEVYSDVDKYRDEDGYYNEDE